LKDRDFFGDNMPEYRKFLRDLMGFEKPIEVIGGTAGAILGAGITIWYCSKYLSYNWYAVGALAIGSTTFCSAAGKAIAIIIDETLRGQKDG